jgi:(p)ppGpp synthase/HD superfamily hydrolase
MDCSTPCQYSIRLIDKLKSLDTKNVLDFELINKAIYWAKKYHGNQKRNSGEPYYSHPLEVAYIFAENIALGEYKRYYTTDLIISTILHDTIEDTLLTKDMIEQGFNQSIANNVEDLTRIKTDKKFTAGETLELIYPQNKKGILYIKICDRLHNLRTIAFVSEIKRNKIIEETIKYFIPLCAFLDLYNIKKELITISYYHKLLEVPQDLISNSGSSLPNPFSDSYLIKLNNPQP